MMKRKKLCRTNHLIRTTRSNTLRLISIQTELYIKASGSRISDTAEVSWSGLIALAMTVIGTMVWHSVRESSNISMVTYTRVTGQTTRLMAMVYTSMPREHDMKEIGRTTSSTDTEMRSGMRVVNMKVDTLWARRKEWESIHGLMARHTTASGRIIE